MSGPRVTSGKESEQIVGTPRDFLDAVEARFGVMDFDLAANAENCVVRGLLGAAPTRFYGPGSSLSENALAEDWEDRDGNLWLNPGFKKARLWGKKSSETPTGPTTRRIFLLVPLSTSRWACNYVHGHALVLGLAQRMKFVGHKTAFPKDLMLAVYGLPPGFQVWHWAPAKVRAGKKARAR